MTERDENPTPETNSAVAPPTEHETPQPSPGPVAGILDAEILSTDADLESPVEAASASDLAAAGQHRAAAGLPTEPPASTGGLPSGSGIGCKSDLAAAGHGDIPTAYEEPVRPRQYHHPLRFGLKALLALTAVCSAQFAFMFYVGTLPGLLVTAFLCAGLLAFLLFTSFVIPQETYRAWAGRLDQMAIRLVLAIVLLLAGAAFAGGGMLIVHYVETLRVAYRVERHLGFSADVEKIWENDDDGRGDLRNAILVTGVRAGGAFHQAGFQKDDVILTELTPHEYYKMLEENRGSSITVNVASGAVGPVYVPVDKCPQRSLVLEIPE